MDEDYVRPYVYPFSCLLFIHLVRRSSTNCSLLHVALYTCYLNHFYLTGGSRHSTRGGTSIQTFGYSRIGQGAMSGFLPLDSPQLSLSATSHFFTTFSPTYSSLHNIFVHNFLPTPCFFSLVNITNHQLQVHDTLYNIQLISPYIFLPSFFCHLSCPFTLS